MQSPILKSKEKQENTLHPPSKLADYIAKVLSTVEELAPLQRCHVLYLALGLTAWPIRQQGSELGLPKEF
jgi:hypothetical protein